MNLCCLVNPELYTDYGITEVAYCVCTYCDKPICKDCIKKFISSDEWYHHEECSKLCDHSQVYHNHRI